MKLGKSSFLLTILLEIMILVSTISSLHNNSFAQTYDTITKQREITKNNPQLQLGRGVGLSASRLAQGSPSELVLHLVGWLVGIKLAADPFTNKIYVANSGSNTVSVISASSDKEISRIPVGTGPVSLISSFNTLEAKGKIYVANLDNNTVSVINASSDKEITRIPVGKNPSHIAVDPFTDKIYVANLGSNTVSVINASSDKEITRIPVGKNPSHIAVDPFTN
ncbi:MAG: YncE family protein, partial [Candidatus Nitrosopolaris sp.]